MKPAFSKVHIQLLVSLILTLTGSVLQAEPRCPGNVASLHLRHLQQSAIIVAVRVNDAGPYDFLIDTGAQITQIDPSLASELRLKIRGTAGVVGVGVYAREVSLVEMNELEAGSGAAEGVLAAVQNLSQLQAVDQHIRGVLGENFLRNFDVLIDYEHNILCLDETKQMGQRVRGERVPLAAATRQEGKTPLRETLVVPVQLSGSEAPTLRLLLDSGISGPLLYHRGNTAKVASDKALIRWAGADGVDQVFVVLAPQRIEIGTRSIPEVSFVAGRLWERCSRDRCRWIASNRSLSPIVYISYAGHYVIFDPR